MARYESTDESDALKLYVQAGTGLAPAAVRPAVRNLRGQRRADYRESYLDVSGLVGGELSGAVGDALAIGVASSGVVGSGELGLGLLVCVRECANASRSTYRTRPRGARG